MRFADSKSSRYVVKSGQNGKRYNIFDVDACLDSTINKKQTKYPLIYTFTHLIPQCLLPIQQYSDQNNSNRIRSDFSTPEMEIK